MKPQWTTSVVLFIAACTSFGKAEADVSYFQDQAKVIHAPHAVSALGADLFGDKVNLYNGSLEFIQTDVSLPGNNALPVMIGRRMATGSEVFPNMQFGTWDLDIPHLHGTYTTAQGWSIPFPSAGLTPFSRCSQFGAPPSVPGAGSGTPSNFTPDEYWHGHFLYVPGQGDQALLRRAPGYTDGPKDGQNYPVVTQKLWALRCLPAMANGAALGEGFLAVSPDGVQYRFDWLATRPVQALYKPGGTGALAAGAVATTASTTGLDKTAPVADAFTSALLPRSEVWIMPTSVTDRFGNKVSYTYNPDKPWQLTRIQSNDGRTITLQYLAGTSRIETVNDGSRTWTYRYTSGGVLESVSLPDAATWELLGAHSLQQNLEISSSCDTTDILSGTNTPTIATLIHPSGASGTFTLTPVTHGRSWVPRSCRGNVSAGTAYAYRPRYFSSLSLTRKSIGGPGVANMDWEYEYGTPNASWSPCNGCVETSSTEVTDPKGDVTVYTFGNRYNLTEGQLQKVEVNDVRNGLLRTTSSHYRAPNAGPYPLVIGSSGQQRGDGAMAEVFTPMDEQTITQQGVSFNWQAAVFDERARATVVNKFRSLGFKRSETTVYADSHASWTPYVLGLVETVTEGSGKVMVSNTYDPARATLLTVSKFGHIEQTLSYHPDGTLATRKDGRNNATSYSNYFRGIPQYVGYADMTSESAVVNNIGKIASLTNATGSTTKFDYDAMGRLAQINYPANDAVAWFPTTITFSKSDASEYGLPAGHWRQIVKTGNAVSIDYLDALWRVVFSQREDSANAAGSSRIIEHQYDHEGRVTFQSYAARTYGQIGDGVRTQYDALGRQESTIADSEIGQLTTAFTYGAGFIKTSRDARGHSATETFQAFDQPDETAIASIVSPESVSVNIVRDVFGKTRSITRSGLGKSATRSYVYDASERLCKTIEPETGATVQDYDLANNIAWHASGLALPSTVTCDNTTLGAPAAKRVVFSYDVLNRLTSTSFGDASPGITRSYKADGLPATVSSNGAVWTMNYNARRLPTTEVLNYGGQNYTIGYSYDAHGNLSGLNYPFENNPLTMRSVSYSPNALGEPTQLGSFASNISYWPSDVIAGFNYGNGKVHSMRQNARGLPELASDAGIVAELYRYDENGNVTGIADQLGGTSTRTMAYDALDRLSSVAAPGMWGNATYVYDALDNIRSSTVGNRTMAHNYDAANRLANVQSGMPGYSFVYGYDAQGNVTSRGAQKFSFDLGNRLSSAANKDTYVYDGFGHRVRTTSVDGSVTTSIYSPAGQLLYSTLRGGPNPPSSTAYVYLHRHQIAEVKR
jgi:YD repeat-containing protein